MTLHIAADGSASGVYWPSPHHVHPEEGLFLVGWSRAGLVSFTVRFEAGGLGACVGRYLPATDGGRLVTHWELAGDIPGRRWSARLRYGFVAGSEVFTRLLQA